METEQQEDFAPEQLPCAYVCLDNERGFQLLNTWGSWRVWYVDWSVNMFRTDNNSLLLTAINENIPKPAQFRVYIQYSKFSTRSEGAWSLAKQKKNGEIYFQVVASMMPRSLLGTCWEAELRSRVNKSGKKETRFVSSSAQPSLTLCLNSKENGHLSLVKWTIRRCSRRERVELTGRLKWNDFFFIRKF